MVWEYIAGVLKKSLGVWERGQRLSAFTFFVLGSFFSAVASWIGVEVKILPGSALMVTYGLAMISVFLVFLVSPFLLWRSATSRIRELEREQIPRLSYGELSLFPKADKGGGQRWRISLHNTGKQQLNECLVKLERILTSDEEYVDENLPVALRTVNQGGQGRRGRFKLSGNEYKAIELIWFRSARPQDKPQIITESHAIPLPVRGQYYVLLRAYSEGAEAAVILLRVVWRKDGSVTVERDEPRQ